MTQKEKKAVVRLMDYMKQLQAKIKEPEISDATDEEVLTILSLLWEWTPTPSHRLPSKHKMENLVGLFRGCADREYCYISRQNVARIIREAAVNNSPSNPLMGIMLSNNWQKLSNEELYDNGKWNYKESSLVDLLFNMHCNPSMYK